MNKSLDGNFIWYWGISIDFWARYLFILLTFIFRGWEAKGGFLSSFIQAKKAPFLFFYSCIKIKNRVRKVWIYIKESWPKKSYKKFHNSKQNGKNVQPLSHYKYNEMNGSMWRKEMVNVFVNLCFSFFSVIFLVL